VWRRIEQLGDIVVFSEMVSWLVGDVNGMPHFSFSMLPGSDAFSALVVLNVTCNFSLVVIVV